MNIISSLSILDYKIGEAIVYLRSDFFDQLFFFITWFGDWKVVFFIAILASVVFYFLNKKQIILLLFVAIIGSGIMTTLIKFMVHRARPQLNIALYAESWPSFPSAHSALSFALFGFLIYCIYKFNLRLSIKIATSVLLLFLILLVGFSRLYLGVHYLTDVIAGNLTGLMWILVSVYILKKSESKI